jgi:hypothetical protein
MTIHVTLTLGQGLGMAANFPDVPRVTRCCQQTVANTQQDFTVDAQVMFQQQIKGFIDTAGRRIFNRNSPKRGVTMLHGIKDIFKGMTGQRCDISPKVLPHRLLRISPMLTLEGYYGHRLLLIIHRK